VASARRALRPTAGGGYALVLAHFARFLCVQRYRSPLRCHKLLQPPPTFNCGVHAYEDALASAVGAARTAAASTNPHRAVRCLYSNTAKKADGSREPTPHHQHVFSSIQTRARWRGWCPASSCSSAVEGKGGGCLLGRVNHRTCHGRPHATHARAQPPPPCNPRTTPQGNADQGV